LQLTCAAMNILIVNQYALPPSQPGGTRHHDFGRLLARRGHHVTIVASNFHYASRVHFDVRRQEQEIDSVRFKWVSTPAYQNDGIARLWNNVVFAVKTTLLVIGLSVSQRGPQIIIGSSVHLLAALAARLLALFLRVPFVMEVRDLWPVTLVDTGVMHKNHPFVMCMSMIERYLYSAARRIIVVMPGAMDYMKSLKVPQKKVIYIPNGMEVCQGEAIDPERVTPDRLSDQPVTISFAGTQGRLDMLDELLRASAKCIHEYRVNLRIEILGNGLKKADNQQLAIDLGIGDRVGFHAAIPRHSVAEFLSRSDFFYVGVAKSPLYKYGISFNKIFQYMSLMRPIIFFGDVAHNPVECANCGYVAKSGTVDELVHLIRVACSDSIENRGMLGRNGYDYLCRHHSMDVLCTKLESMLLGVCVELKSKV
jgi:glycosyltransferase involved in cell wall biosynthesis